MAFGPACDAEGTAKNAEANVLTGTPPSVELGHLNACNAHVRERPDNGIVHACLDEAQEVVQAVEAKGHVNVRMQLAERVNKIQKKVKE
jgi:hypothetical protein